MTHSVLLIIPFADQPIRSGGILSASLSICDHFRSHEIKTDVLYLSSLAPNNYSNQKNYILGTKDVFRNEDISLLIYDHVKNLQKYDYIIFPDMGGFAFETIRAVKKNLLKTKIIVIGHACTLWNIENNNKSLVRSIEKKIVFLEKFCLENCDQLIPVSYFYRDWLLRNDVNNKNLNVIPNFIPDGVKMNLHQESVSNKKEIVFIGRLSLQKGIDLFLKAIALLNKEEYCVIFYVHSDKERLDRLIEEVESLKIDYEINENKDCKSLSRPRSLFVIPSIGGETSSMVLLESIALNRKFILSNIEPFREIISPTDPDIRNPFFELTAIALKGKIEESFNLDKFSYNLNYSNDQILNSWKLCLENNSTSPELIPELHKPEISLEIGIIYYDRPVFIKKLLRSLNQLTNTDVKIHILINKGELSAETVRECLAVKLHEQFILYNIPSEVSTTTGRNFLAMQMKSEFIIFLDDDNFLAENFFSEVINVCKTEDSDIVTTNKYLINDSDEIVGVYSYIGGDSPQMYFENTFGDTCALIKRTFFQKLTGFKELEIFEDWDFYIRARQVGAVHSHCPSLLLYYRIHPKNKSRIFDHSFYYHKFIEGFGLSEIEVIKHKEFFFEQNKRSIRKIENFLISTYVDEKYLCKQTGKSLIKPINGQFRIKNLNMKCTGYIYLSLISFRSGTMSFCNSKAGEDLDVAIKTGKNHIKITLRKDCCNLKVKTNIETFYIQDLTLRYLR